MEITPVESYEHPSRQRSSDPEHDKGSSIQKKGCVGLALVQ